jgi:hypothetical protein
MGSSRLDRQSFLGPYSERVLSGTRAAVVGLGGGGSHIAQQLAHIGIGHLALFDPQTIEDTNLNRLVGGTENDVEEYTPKVEIAARLIRAVNSKADVQPIQAIWQSKIDLLRDCDVVFGCVDRFRDREELERTTRRFLIPYIDVGMDVHPFAGAFLITGQVTLSLPGQYCLWCMGLLTEELLTQEAREYGAAGSRPQVIWPNGVLASSAVGLFMNLVTPWQAHRPLPLLLEYDGNAHRVVLSNKLAVLRQTFCTHHPITDLGDPFFKIT